MYLGIFNRHAFTINSQRIANPISLLLSDKRHAAPIMLDRGSIVPIIYLCVSHTEALLIASNTSYHKRLHDSRRFAHHILTLFVACRCLAVLTHDIEREGSILLCFM
jgi:hypothetical protein